MKKILLICGGILSFCLGILGIFVPGLPTTPFLLLTSFCFVKSSRKLHLWLVNHRLFGQYLSNFLAGKTWCRKTKIYSLSLMWLMLGFSFFCLLPHLYLKFLVLGVGLTGTFFMVRIPCYQSSGQEKKILKNHFPIKSE
jgi:hypothetical protein